MSSFFRKNVPSKAKRNEIPEAIKAPLQNILNVHLLYVCDPENGKAEVTPHNSPVLNDKGEIESVQIGDLYDVSQINFMDGEIPVTKLYLKAGVNKQADGQALQRMVNMVHTGLCEVFLKNYYVDLATSELGKKYVCTVDGTGEKKTFYDTYTGYFVYLIPRSCGLATLAEVKAKAQGTKAQESEEDNASPFVNSSPVVSNASGFNWGAKA